MKPIPLETGHYWVKASYYATAWTPGYYQKKTDDWWIDDIQFDWDEMVEVNTNRLIPPDEQ